MGSDKRCSILRSLMVSVPTIPWSRADFLSRKRLAKFVFSMKSVRHKKVRLAGKQISAMTSLRGRIVVLGRGEEEAVKSPVKNVLNWRRGLRFLVFLLHFPGCEVIIT
jgi:hypothetical protein